MQYFPITISEEIIKNLFSIFLTLLIAIISDNIIRSFIKVPKNFENRRSRTYISILRRTVTVIIYILAANFILIELGINVTPFLASASIIGIVVGIGARQLIEDLINGIFLLTQDFVTIGDQIKIDDAEGTVEKVGFRTLVVRGDTGELHMIPNGQVKKIINFSRHKSYTNIDFPIKSDQDIDTALQSMREALHLLEHDKNLSPSIYPGSSVLGIEEFKIDGKTILRTKVITNLPTRAAVVRHYRYLVKKQFEKNKIALV